MTTYRRVGPIALAPLPDAAREELELLGRGFRPRPLGDDEALRADRGWAREWVPNSGPPAPPPPPHPPPPPKRPPVATEDGFLKVKVHEEGATATIIADVEVSIDGPTKATMNSRAVNGIADFGAVPPGHYAITVRLPEKVAKTWAPPLDKLSTSVSAKQEQLAFAPLPKVDLVTPKLEAEYPVALLDRKLDAHQAASEAVKLKPDPTYLLLSASQAGGSVRYAKAGRLTVANVAVFRDEACTQAFDASQPIPAADLMGASPLKLWLRGSSAGKSEFKLALDPPGDARLTVAPPATLEFGVVELKCELYQHDVAAIAKLKVDPDTDPVSKYHDELEKLALPDQVVMSDKGKIADGRLLHVQDAGHFGRAKLVLKAREAGQWPAAANTVEIALSAQGSGGLKLFDAETDGAEVPLPLKIASASLSADRTYWLEGSAESDALRGTTLSVGIDRAAGGPAHAAKAHGDAARCTVVKIDSIVVDYKPEAGKAVAWDDKQHRWTINLKPDPQGRKLDIVATLSKKLAGVKLHFMLAPDAANGKVANWGIDLPDAVAVRRTTTAAVAKPKKSDVTRADDTLTWKWKDIPAALKHLDRADRKDYLHLAVATDTDGKAKQTLTLSRCGGDKFVPMVYVEQDPHLAKYVHEHAKLKARKPAACKHDIQVWRRFWGQRIAVAGVPSPALAPAVGQYERIRTDFAFAPDIQLTLAEAKAMNPPSIYARYMIELNGGNADALLVSDTNKGQFFAKATVDGDRPLKVTMVVCDAQWDPHPDGATPVQNVSGLKLADFPRAVDCGSDRKLLMPPLQGGNIVVSGTWTRANWDPAAGGGAGAWTGVVKTPLLDAHCTIDPARTDLGQIRIALPAGWAAAATPATSFWLENLSFQCARSYLGECAGRPPRLLAVFDPTEPDDFQNTVVHECGHAFGQAPRAGKPGGVPDHPETVDLKQGNHCWHDVNKCVMYDSGPIAGSHNRFCDVCHPYLLLNDFSAYG